MKTLINTLILLLFLIQNINANEYRGGQISITQLSTSSIQADVELLIDVHSDIENLEICWGDGICTAITAQSIESIPTWGLKKYNYTVLHSYQDQGTYTVSIENCCFDDEIANMPNADDDPFVIETRITLGTSFNTTPYYPFIGASVGSVNEPAGIFGWDDDPEGDEYVSELCDIDVDTYSQPDISLPVPGNVIFNNSSTGSVSWNSPPIEGTYTLQSCVTEFRNGEEISFSKRIICFMAGDFASATAEPISDLGLSIFPNPIQNKKLWIHNDGSAPNTSLNIRIHNINQQLVFEEKATTAFDTKAIDLSELSAGVYFILMQTERRSYYEKFVIVE